jgi:hypothetical protein
MAVATLTPIAVAVVMYTSGGVAVPVVWLLAGYPLRS